MAELPAVTVTAAWKPPCHCPLSSTRQSTIRRRGGLDGGRAGCRLLDGTGLGLAAPGLPMLPATDCSALTRWRPSCRAARGGVDAVGQIGRGQRAVMSTRCTCCRRSLALHDPGMAALKVRAAASWPALDSGVIWATNTQHWVPWCDVIDQCGQPVGAVDRLSLQDVVGCRCAAAPCVGEVFSQPDDVSRRSGRCASRVSFMVVVARLAGPVELRSYESTLVAAVTRCHRPMRYPTGHLGPFGDGSPQRHDPDPPWDSAMARRPVSSHR